MHVVAEALVRTDTIAVTADFIGTAASIAQTVMSLGGRAIGVSPALSLGEHHRLYPSARPLTTILASGFHQSGQQLFFVRSSDALIFFGANLAGRLDLRYAVDDGKPIGFLLGMGENMEESQQIRRLFIRQRRPIFAETDPDRLVKHLLQTLHRNAGYRR